ncbi:MAG: GNAT family N-acetyltransferase [Treponema sp.]|nr:GNAT family N-acetyltransferase [Treponema sp.]
MLIQLRDDKKDLAEALFKKRQPNNSALWAYFLGKMTGKTFVDDEEAPTKAICVLDMSWTFVSDDADFAWIEETLREIIKTAWIQVVWDVAIRPETPLSDNKKRVVIPRFEYTERQAFFGENETGAVELVAFNSELYEKLPWKDFHNSVYGSKENFLEKTFGFYALENGVVCSECEAAFIANGYTEIGIITEESKRRRGFAFAACVRTLEEIDRRALKPIWACDKDNLASIKLAEKLGFMNPYEYDFIFFPQQN